MNNLFDLKSVRRVLATEAQLRGVREAMHALIPVENEADLCALRTRFEADPIDPEAARLQVLGEQLAVLSRVVLEESLLALAEVGFDAASGAVAQVLDELRVGHRGLRIDGIDGS